MISYVLGFMFTRDHHKLLLLKKANGVNAGMWNGIGGKVDPGESFEEAMAREFEEEAQFKTVPSDWTYAADIVAHGPKPAWRVAVFRSVFMGQSLLDVLTSTPDGPKRWVFVGDIYPNDEMFAPHVRSLIHTLRDQLVYGPQHSPKVTILEAR